MKRNKIAVLLIIAASIAGFVLSTLLVLEYFGLSPAAADAVCSRGSGVNACIIVSSSRFAAIRGIPFVGDVPTAVFGFILYGFVAVIAVMQFINRSEEEILHFYSLILILSITALTGDVALYLVSAYIIKFICPLCSMTYAATAVILISSVIMVKKNISSTGDPFIMRMINYFKRNIMTYVTIVVILASAGISLGAAVRAIAQGKDASSYEERLQKAIRQYESEKETDISLTEAPVFGNKNASAKFAIFFDFTCSHCFDEFIVMENLLKKYPDNVSVAFKFFPLDGSCDKSVKGSENSEAGSCDAFAAAVCSHRQGKFIEYAKILFENYHKKEVKFSIKTVRDAAKKVNMDIAGFDLCFESKQTWDYIRKEYMETEKLGLTGTPTIFLNGKMLKGGTRRADMLEGLVKYCSIRNN